EDVEEGEILDDAAAGAMEVDPASPRADPELAGDHAATNSAVEPSRCSSPSKDEGRLNHTARGSESGGVFSGDEDNNNGEGHGQSHRASRSPRPTKDRGRNHKDERQTLSSNKDSHQRDHTTNRSPPSRNHAQEVHSRNHPRSGEADAKANGSRASPRADPDRDNDDRNGFGRHATRTREDERERSSSRVVRDGHSDRRDSRERYRDETRHSSIDRDNVDRRHRERSSSHSRPDRRESARHTREESRERERQSGSSRHKDHHKRDTSKDRYKDYVTVATGHERDKVRDDRDRGRHRDRESETRRSGAGEERKDRVSTSDRHKDSTRSKYSTSDAHKDRSRSGEKGRDVDSRSDRSREMKENSFKEEDEEEYQEKIEQQLAMQEEDDPEKIKEEARRRKEAIMAKYRQQQAQKQQPESLPRSNDEEARAVDKDETVDMKGDNDSNSTDNEEAENKQDSSDAFVGEADFSVGKSPAHDAVLACAEALGNEGTTGVSGLGEGTPKSERSADMFCDDIFGESPAGFRKLGKGDGLCIEKNALHDNWDDPEGYYTHRFGELLDGRYEITAAHGKGVFSTVVRAKDLKAGKDDPDVVAIKIIRKNETMYKAGKQEVSILEKLASADREDRRHCVRFISSFMYRNHLCLVFESLNMNLREVLKKFGRNIGLKLTAVRAYSKQLFIALKHLKNCKVLHCDIKPDNMLVNDAKNVLKLCDFGNAMLAGMNEVTPYLVSRFYRAPEIILGLPYDHPLDIWSVGCCLYELSTGKVLFPGATNNDMLRLHMELKGPFPKKMLRKGAFTMQHFDQDLNFNAIEEDPVTKKPMRKLILNIKPKDFGSLVSNFPGEDPKMLSNFKDLLEKIFVLDPDKRITVSQALSHPFITAMRSECVPKWTKHGVAEEMLSYGPCCMHLPFG
uniref:non-specific serine/threonine protein kinase n=1 Tax=Aegilops tauschii subsp. strangulata TaxID=200361 RepID=A0A453JEQ2_AEGTS